MIAYEDRLSRGGRTAREVAEEAGLSIRQVQNWTSRPRAEYLSEAEQRYLRIRELRAQGGTMRQIAADLGVSVSAVHYALHKG